MVAKPTLTRSHWIHVVSIDGEDYGDDWRIDDRKIEWVRADVTEPSDLWVKYEYAFSIVYMGLLVKNDTEAMRYVKNWAFNEGDEKSVQCEHEQKGIPKEMIWCPSVVLPFEDEWDAVRFWFNVRWEGTEHVFHHESQHSSMRHLAENKGMDNYMAHLRSWASHGEY